MQAVAFFDMFSFPLTTEEIWFYLPMRASRRDLNDALRYLAASGTLERSGAFWHLPGRADFVRERSRRYLSAERKYRRAFLIVRFFRLLPWVRMVAIANQIGPRNLRDGGDIDLFVIAARGRLWLCRLGMVFITMLFRWRPKINDTRDKICLSFFVSEDALDLRPLMLSGEKDFRPAASELDGYWISEAEYPEADHYFIYWLAGLRPLYDSGQHYRRLIEANAWLHESLPQWRPWRPSSYRYYLAGGGGLFWKKFLDLPLSWLEPLSRRFQLAVMPGDMKAALGKDKRVVAARDVLKLHLNDRRAWYAFEYLKRLRKWL